MKMMSAVPVGASSDISDKRLQRLYEYWIEKQAGRAAPAQRDINPVEISDLLGFINIFDVQDEPRDYKVRLNGCEVAEMLGREITGKFCSEVFSGKDADACKAAFDLCVEKCAPVTVQTSLGFCGKPYRAQMVLALPLSSDGVGVDMIITAFSYHYADSKDHPVEPMLLREVRQG
jgi:hypothetical protein